MNHELIIKNMKKLIITIALICAASGFLSAQAIHEFSAYAAGGLSTLRYQLSSGNGSGGFGGEFGAGYTYLQIRDGAVATGTVNHQSWGIHAGIGLGLYNAKAKLNNVKIVTANLNDGDVKFSNFDLHTTLSGYNENQTAMFLNIPVMAQFNISQFYVMGGIKAGIPLNGKYKSKDATLTNRAYYPELDNWAETQEFRGLGTFRGKNYDGNIDLGVSVMLSLEAGMSWSINDNLFLYSGAYFDYGLNNVAKGDNMKFINYSASNPENFTANSVLSSYADDSKSTAFTDKVNTMAVGIKVRVAFRK